MVVGGSPWTSICTFSSCYKYTYNSIIFWYVFIAIILIIDTYFVSTTLFTLSLFIFFLSNVQEVISIILSWIFKVHYGTWKYGPAGFFFYSRMIMATATAKNKDKDMAPQTYSILLNHYTCPILLISYDIMNTVSR